MQLPGTGINIDGTLGLLQGDINEIGLTASQINKGPLGEVPVWLQSIGMDVNNIADPDQPLTFTGTLGVTLGPALSSPITLSFPSWTGIPSLSISSLASIDGTATVDANHFDGMDTVTFLNPAILSGTEDIDADWQKGSISLSGTLSAPRRALHGHGPGPGLDGRRDHGQRDGVAESGPAGQGAGPELAVVSQPAEHQHNATLYVAPGFDSSSLAQDYVEVTGSVGKFGTVGLQVFFNGTINVIDKLSLNLFGDPTFQVSTGTSSVLVGAEWTVPLQGGGVTLVLTDPDGHQTTVNTANPPDLRGDPVRPLALQQQLRRGVDRGPGGGDLEHRGGRHDRPGHRQLRRGRRADAPGAADRVDHRPRLRHRGRAPAACST